jgi:hypothetical protein
MTIREKVELTTSELTDGLLFRAVWKDSVRGWAVWLAKQAILLLIIWLVLSLFIRSRSLDATLPICLYVAFCAPAIWTRWLRGCVAEVKVTAHEIAATGNLGQNILSKTIAVPISGVESLRWYSGGLHLARGWRPPLRILPVSNEGGQTVLKTILSRFPGTWEEYLTPASFRRGMQIALKPARFYDREPESDGTEPGSI